MTGRLTDSDFRALRDHLAGIAGLAFDEGRRNGLEAVVAERMTATRRRSVAAYLSLVAGPGGEEEVQALLDAVTIQETQFFRNQPQIQALRRRVLPELLRRAALGRRPLTIWSAGCSTGEEPYTLAMLVLELAAATGHEPPQMRVVGTDVSAAAIATAALARYSGRALAHVPAAALDRWFDVGHDGSATVKDEVRALVELRLHNLVTEREPFEPGEVDLIVCRNVTIYFGRDTTRALVARFHRALADGGYLLLGHAETLWQMSEAYTLVPLGDAFVYRRGQAARAPVVPRTPDRPSAGRPALSAVGSSSARRVSDPLAAARAALVAGRYLEAARLAEAVIDQHPLLAPAYIVAGQAHATIGAHSRAVAALRKAVYLDSRAGHAHFLLAGALARLGSNAAAVTAYRAAAATLPSVDRAVLAEILDGRDVTELVELCGRLADLTEQEAVS